MSDSQFNSLVRSRMHAKDFAEKSRSINPVFILIAIAAIVLVAKVVAA